MPNELKPLYSLTAQRDGLRWSIIEWDWEWLVYYNQRYSCKDTLALPFRVGGGGGAGLDIAMDL